MLKTVSLVEEVISFPLPGIRESDGVALGQGTAGSPQSKHLYPSPKVGESLSSQVLLPWTVLTCLFVNTHVMYVSV